MLYYYVSVYNYAAKFFNTKVPNTVTYEKGIVPYATPYGSMLFTVETYTASQPGKAWADPGFEVGGAETRFSGVFRAHRVKTSHKVAASVLKGGFPCPYDTFPHPPSVKGGPPSLHALNFRDLFPSIP